MRGSGLALIFAFAERMFTRTMKVTTEDADPFPRSAQLDKDEFVSSIAVIACVVLLLLVVVALTVFTRLSAA